jgi:hypothetical protein
MNYSGEGTPAEHFDWPGDVSRAWTSKEIATVVFPRAVQGIIDTRKALDANATLPIKFGKLIMDIEGCYQTTPTFGPLIWAVLARTNLIPAAIPRADYSVSYRSRYPTSAEDGQLCWYTGDHTIGFMATAFAKKHNSLWWDSEMGAATVKALGRVISGELEPMYGGCNTSKSGIVTLGERDRPTPPWLAAALQTLSAGEDWILKLNTQQIAGTGGIIEAARAWLPEAAWFGWNPYHRRFMPMVTADVRGYDPDSRAFAITQVSNYRNVANAALTTLVNRFKQAGAIQAQTETTAIKVQAAIKMQATVDAKLNDVVGFRVPRISPPSTGMPTWQKMLITAVAAGGGIASLTWLKQRKVRSAD